MKKAQLWDILPLVPLSPRGQSFFTYAPPTATERSPEPDTKLGQGILVRIPFGRRMVRGIAWKPAGKRRTPVPGIKPVTTILTDGPLFSQSELTALVALADASLEPLSSLAEAAFRVREPLATSRGPRAAAQKEQARETHEFQVEVRWTPIAEALPDSLAKGQMLVLVPETATAHPILRELARRGIPAAFFTQSQRIRERRALMERLLAGHSCVVVATHAGIFLPFPVLDRIIVAEASLPSHRQWNLHPRYDARVAALLLAHARRIPLILQSTLPSLDLWNIVGNLPASPGAESATWEIIPRLRSDPLLSTSIFARMRRVLERGGSVFLFHDTVGTERLFSCQTCGATLFCPACRGILERRGAGLRCRSCDAAAGPVQAFCPRCRSPHFGPRRTGTAALAQQLQRAFPRVAVRRMDRETLPRVRRTVSPSAPTRGMVIGSERAFADTSDASFDAVMVIEADRLLEDGSFNASERFALLVARLGQLAKPQGVRLLQTAHPNLPVVRAAALTTFDPWITEELNLRKTLGYPPFAALLRAQKPARSLALGEAAARHLVSRIASDGQGTKAGYRVFGAVPHVRADVLIRGPLHALQRALRSISQGWSSEPIVPLSALLKELQEAGSEGS